MTFELLKSTSFLLRTGGVIGVAGMWILMRSISTYTRTMAQLNPLPTRRERELSELEIQTLEKRIRRIKRLNVAGIILVAVGTAVILAALATSRSPC